jgi:rubrerythrin
MNAKTIENLKTAFAGESQARNKYTFFAGVARKEGWLKLAEVFEETAENEKQHAKELFKMLNGIGDSDFNLDDCIAGETYEYKEMYPTFAKEAREVGDIEAAILFENIAKVELHHAERYALMKDMLKKEEFLKKDKKVTWICTKCGYMHEGEEPPKACPLCKHPKEYFELMVEVY